MLLMYYTVREWRNKVFICTLINAGAGFTDLRELTVTDLEGS